MIRLEPTHASEHGTACLAAVLWAHGFPDLRDRLAEIAYRELGRDLHRGSTPYALGALARHLGFEVHTYLGDLGVLGEVRLPCIVHLGGARFVVVYALHAGGVEVLDPLTGDRTEVPRARFAAPWSGAVLELLPTEQTDAEIDEHGAAPVERPQARMLRALEARLVAKSGFASIHRGRRRGRVVAIKVVPSYLDDDHDAVQAFRREAAMLRRTTAFAHPNVVELIDIDEPSRALVLEWADEALDERAPLPSPDALGCARQIAAALGALHARGIVHRDVTPRNVLLLPGGVAKLCGFGAAESLDAVRAGDAGARWSARAYASPEQRRGDVAGARSDVFSLGLTLFRALTGSALFAPEHDAIAVALDAHEPASLAALEARMWPRIVDAAEAQVRAHLRGAGRGADANADAGAGAIASLVRRLLAYEPSARPDARTAEDELAELTRRATGRTG